MTMAITAYYRRPAAGNAPVAGFAPLTAAAAVPPAAGGNSSSGPSLTVAAALQDGTPLHMWTVIEPASTAGAFVVTVHNYGNYTFDRWADGYAGARRAVTVEGENAILTAYYRLSHG
jgi:hypothetical protein